MYIFDHYEYSVVLSIDIFDIEIFNTKSNIGYQHFLRFRISNSVNYSTEKTFRLWSVCGRWPLWSIGILTVLSVPSSTMVLFLIQLEQFRRPSQKALSNGLPHIVGVSFDMERLLQLSTARTTSPNLLLVSCVLWALNSFKQSTFHVRLESSKTVWDSHLSG
jgi:hypothetical protein